MSRFAADPKWLVYLPPTMAPTATSRQADLLEHPAEAFAFYRSEGVPTLVCEEKHMGSRAVVVLCRDEAVAARRFGVAGGSTGVVYTRTGREFFDERERTELLLDRLRTGADATGLWSELDTDWLVLDAELLPWSAKAGELLRRQYAPVGAAARAVLPAVVSVLEHAAARGLHVADLLDAQRRRLINAHAFTAAYGRYCWPVGPGLDGIRLAPFQILAGERSSHASRDHAWHLDLIDRLVEADPGLLHPTRRLVVDVDDPASIEAGTAWWTDLTGAGGEGMVIKPLTGTVRGPRGPVQPGIKCRGPDYLRIIYGPDYTEPANLPRLRQRNINRKRSLAVREHALGLEALRRLTTGEPRWRIHEAVFAILALESEPIDPRL
jgi:protein phosphatase